MDLEGSLSCTQEPPRYHYTEADYFCHALLSYLFKAHFNIILTSTHVCFNWSFIFQTSHTKSVRIPFLLHMRQMLYFYHSLLFVYSNFICRKAQILRSFPLRMFLQFSLLFPTFFSQSIFLNSECSKFFSQHFLLNIRKQNFNCVYFNLNVFG